MELDLNIIHETDYLCLACHESATVGFMLWKKPATLNEVKRGFMLAIQQIRRYKIRHWLIDIRLRGLLDTEAEDWVYHDLRPAAVKLSEGTLRCAVLLKQEQYRQQVQEYSLCRGIDVEGLEINYFTSATDSLDWLSLDATSVVAKMNSTQNI